MACQRESSIHASGEIGIATAIIPLKEVAQNDTNSDVREAAKEALKKPQQKKNKRKGDGLRYG